MKLKHLAVFGVVFSLFFSMLFFFVIVFADSDDSSSNNFDVINGGLNFTEDVLKHRPTVEKYCKRQIQHIYKRIASHDIMYP